MTEPTPEETPPPAEIDHDIIPVWTPLCRTCGKTVTEHASADGGDYWVHT